jgi:DNA-binding MarR family transcriptional regulator
MNMLSGNIMAKQTATDWSMSEAQIILSLLEAVERNGTQSQRHLAAEFGIALGLVNAYLKRCVRKGLLKVTTAPTRRYTYYLTPRGFAEKSRLTFTYLSYSLSFFRQARADCKVAFTEAKRIGWSRIILAGVSDLAEISAICGLETGVTICALVDDTASQRNFVGAPIFTSFHDVSVDFDGIMITDLSKPQQTYDRAVKHFGADRVCAPSLLGIALSRHHQHRS